MVVVVLSVIRKNANIKINVFKCFFPLQKLNKTKKKQKYCRGDSKSRERIKKKQNKLHKFYFQMSMLLLVSYE